MLCSYKFFTFSQPFSQHPNKFYYKKFLNIHLTKNQNKNIEQKGEQDWCVKNELCLGWVENEIGFGWIGLGWWRSRWRRRWASNGNYGCDLADIGVRSRQCWDVISVVLQAARSRRCWGATRPVWSGVGVGARVQRDQCLVRSLLVVSLSLSLFYFPGVDIIWR